MDSKRKQIVKCLFCQNLCPPFEKKSRWEREREREEDCYYLLSSRPACAKPYVRYPVSFTSPSPHSGSRRQDPGTHFTDGETGVLTLVPVV